METQLSEILAWLAPAATMIAAMMTAANLGARITGWGFVVFCVGSIAWTSVGLSTDQTNLLATNAFLTVVNLIGVWRWLGRQRAYEDGGRSAKKASLRSSQPTLFTASEIAGMPVMDRNGRALGNVVEALLTCRTGSISYIVVASGGLGGIAETLRAISSADVRFGCDQLRLNFDAATFETQPVLNGEDWPAAPFGNSRSTV